MKLVYFSQISQDDIDKAIEGTNLPNRISSFDIQKEKESRRNWVLTMIGIGIVTFFCSYNYGSSLFMLVSIGIIFYALFSELPKINQVRSTLGEVSPVIATEQFYKTVLEDRFGTMIEAYRLLAPAATEQIGAKLVESFKTTWVEFAEKKVQNKLFEKYTSSQNKNASPFDFMVFFRDIKVTSTEVQPKVRNVQCISTAILSRKSGGGTFANRDVDKIRIELNNVSVQIGARWFLMTGLPGELTEDPVPNSP